VGQLSRCPPAAGKEVPVAALELPVDPILVPARGVIVVRVEADDDETGLFAARIEHLLHALQLGDRSGADRAAACVGHRDHDALAEQIAQGQRYAPIVTPLLRQLIEPRGVVAAHPAPLASSNPAHSHTVRQRIKFPFLGHAPEVNNLSALQL